MFYRSRLITISRNYPTNREFSFEKLPSPLKPNSQKTALKLIAVSRKVQDLARLHSEEDLTRMTGKIDKRFSKSASLTTNCRSTCMEPTFTFIMNNNLNTGLTKAKIEKIIAKSEQIEQKLLELNLRLVHSIALQHQGMGLELDDLVYEGKTL